MADFSALVAQVANLATALQEQKQANTRILDLLQATREECVELKLQLRAVRSKRPRRSCSADATVEGTSPELSGSEAAMGSGDELDSSPARRGPMGGDSPHNV